MDPENIIELQPAWNDITPDTLTGVVTVYVDLTDEHGAIDPQSPEVPVTFKRVGNTAANCRGLIELKVPDYALILEGSTPMLYGPTGDPLRNVDGVLVAGGFDTDDCDTVFQDVGGLTWSEVFDQVQSTPNPQSVAGQPVYQFQQAEWGDLWAMPIEPVHPQTRGFFWRVNELGGSTSSPSDSCWCGYPVQNLAGTFFEYRDGATGQHYRVTVNDVLDAAVGAGNMALHPIDVPLGKPLALDDISKDWQDERDLADEQGVSLSDSWRHDRENCKPPLP